MKLYTTTTSERGKPVNKGGNDYIESLYYITDRLQPNYRVRVIDDSEAIGQVYFSVQCYFFGKWHEKYSEVIHVNMPSK